MSNPRLFTKIFKTHLNAYALSVLSIIIFHLKSEKRIQKREASVMFKVPKPKQYGGSLMATLNEIKTNFNPTLKIGLSHERLTSDGGLILYKEAAHKIGYFQSLHDTLHIQDQRKFHEHGYPSVVEQLIFQHLAGYHRDRFAKTLMDDPVFTQAMEKDYMASQPTLSRMYGALTPENIDQMNDFLLQASIDVHRWLDQHQITIDVDSTYFQTYGNQENSAFNMHYKTTGFHPLLAFDCMTGMCLRAVNRSGEQYTSKGAEDMVADIIESYLNQLPHMDLLVRGDSGFALPALYETCEAKQVHYVIRLKANAKLHSLAEEISPIPSPSCEYGEVHYDEFDYQASSWDRPRRVVVRYEKQATDLLFTHTFIVTDLTSEPKVIFQLYKKRGEMELFIKEAKNDFGCKYTSSHDFTANCARMMMSLMAYNLHITTKNLFFTPALKSYRMGTFRSLVIKVGAKLTKSGRYLHLKLSKSFVYQEEFFRTLRMIQA
jgi:hypothetical protein